MPDALSATVPALLVAAVVTAAASARAEPAQCGPAATVRVETAPEIDPSTARRVVEQVLAEVSASAKADCAARRKNLIEVHWMAKHRVHLAVEVQGAADTERAERDLDVAAVSADGRLLAIAIAADELLTEARARQKLVEAHAPAGPLPSAAPPAPPLLPVRHGGITRGLGAALALDVIGGDVLLGPDARVALWFTPHVSLSARLGLRATANGFDPWAAIVGGARAPVSPIAWNPRRGAAFTAGADVLALRLRSGGPLAVRAAPSGGLAGWMQVSPSLVLVGDVGAGAAIGGLPGPRGSGSAALAIGASFGFVAPF
jgi:hypothetical protein